MIEITKLHHRLKRSIDRMVRITTLIVLGFCCSTVIADSNDSEKDKFDHLAETGFDLSAVHRVAECTDCHIFGTFEGTPRTCRGCHGSQGIRTASRKGAMHILSTDNCENCHQTSTANSWVPVRRVDHLEVRGACYRCHNGVLADGKPPQHIRTANDCDSCHRNTRTWQNVARVDHAAIPEAQAGQCIVCHFNGSRYGGRQPGHIRGGIDSTNNCAACHTTVGNWPVRRVDHNEIARGAGIPGGASNNCSACHESIRPPFIPAAPHPGPPTDCGAGFCHGSTIDWCSSVGFSLPGLCN